VPLLKLFIEAVLLWVFVQDIKERSVYWFLFPALTMAFLWVGLLQGRPFAEVTHTTLINAGFLIFQYLMVSAYFSVKNKKWVNITAGLMGWGDVLFLLTLCCYLSVLNFLAFYITSLLLVLTIWLIWMLLAKRQNKQVPLAGLQALVLAIFFGFCWWISPIDVTSDDWLLKLVYK
jgi:Flp pilus assembly protein protease CpaA